MLSLQQASRIYSEFSNIMETGESSYLSDAVVHRFGKICDYMNNLNANSVLYSKSDFSAKSFIQSLQIDGIEVIGYKKHEYKSGYGYNYGNSYKQFYVDVDKICELANPALFGKGSETVYDETVRKAFDVTADRIKIIEKESFLKEVNYNFGNIIPSDKKFRYELYKMHVYKEGGKFTRHKDTIHAPNHYATLVISVPTDFQGGELLLYENKNDETPLTECKFKEYLYKENSVIFLTDVEHEVLEVKSGTRVVMQYDVYLEDKDDAKEDKDKENEEEEDDEYEDEEEDCDGSECFYDRSNKSYLSSKKYVEELNVNADELLLEQVENFMLSHPNDEICFLLSREYPLSVSLKYLKEGDKKLYDILSSKYLIEIGYVVNHYFSDYDGSYDYETREKLKVMNYTNVKKFIHKFNEDFDDQDKDENKDNTNKENNTHIFVTGGKFKTMKAVDYCEHTGNEAAPAEYTYVSVVLCCKRKD